jgi:mono/diheme cytochrome c family protein
MRKTVTLSIAFAGVVAAALFWGSLGNVSKGAAPAANAAAAKDPKVARGEYIVSFAGCDDCHSPKVMTDKGPMPDMTRRLSGHPAGSKLPPFKKEDITPQGWLLFSQDLTACVGPWGVTCSANLTPDQNTGIGLWTEDMFVNAIRTGKHMGMGRPIMPPMPWYDISNLSDEDLRAVYAYLKSIPPVSNAVPAPMTLDDYAAMNK